MKNQYVGDINDYRKYGLLRAILEATDLRLLVGWMLTSNDGSADGKRTDYLDDPDRWARYDRPLFDGLKTRLSNAPERSVTLIERSGLLPEASYYAAVVPSKAAERTVWFESLRAAADRHDLVFLDPDIGIEVKSKAFGRKDSPQYLYWHEIETLWADGRSLLIYQHFPRVTRPAFVQRMMDALQEHTPSGSVEAFSTTYVVFLMALQTPHQRYHAEIVDLTRARWGSEIRHWDLAAR
jgi:hypothetical protein